MKYLVSALLVFLTLGVFSQPKIEFPETTYDYDDIMEDGGIANAKFVFTNTGNQPLILNNVRATCGCTTPEWTREPILPGKTGMVTVGYNPKNRPGAFSKSVNVYSNSQPGVNVLYIKGKVLPREKSMEEIYPRITGPIRWKSNFMSFGNILNTEIKTQEIEFINASDAPAKMDTMRSPEHISVKFEPQELAPGKTGMMIITFDARKKDAYGTTSDRIYLLINNEKHNTYSVGVSATVNEDFSLLTPEQKANAPVAVFNDKVFDFGSIKQGEKITNIFKLTNTGKSDLLIRNVRASCGCTAVKNENIVKPGKTIDITVEFNSRGKRNRQNKSITITTNDPLNPTSVLRVMGTVEN